MLINIDCDGVLLPNTHELSLFSKANSEDLSFNDTSPIWDWYDKLVKTKLDVNVRLVKYLYRLKDMGNHIRLWTNRSYTLKSSTLDNLDCCKSLFDSFEFYNGHKIHSQVEGIVIDNNIEYLKCGEFGIHYEWKEVI